MLESVWKGAERIRTLARSLLTFSRPSQEEPIPLPVNELVERALDLCRYQILKAGISLEKDLAFDLAPVLGVSNQLEMALINLIVNAAQALDGRETRVLRLATEAGDGVVRIRISDTGPGIPASLQASVFEPFVTTKSEGHGTGLGLSTVLMIVEHHGGRIDMETASEKGTTFTITLPASRQPPAAPLPPPRG